MCGLCVRAAGRIARLVVDFDETLTERDTIGGLMGLAQEAARQVRLHYLYINRSGLPYPCVMGVSPY